MASGVTKKITQMDGAIIGRAFGVTKQFTQTDGAKFTRAFGVVKRFRLSITVKQPTQHGVSMKPLHKL